MTMTAEFESVIRELRPQLLGYLRRLVGDADAEDVTQVALSRGSAALAEFRGDSSLRSWLFKIATNCAHDWNRARKGTVPISEEPQEEGESLGWTDGSNPDRQLLREEMSHCVAEILGGLPENYQTVLALSDCEELSDREVAEVLGVTVGTAKIRLHRARVRLREALERDCSFYRDQENTLCCDRIENSSAAAYPSDEEARHQVERCQKGDVPKGPSEETIMSTTETLSTKQKHLIGIGAAIGAGCHPCTESYVSAARTAGACERGVRFAIESGLVVRESARTATETFANETFSRPELDVAFRQERALLGALTQLAATIATNAATSLLARIEAARALGATDDQIRVAAEIARITKRGAEGETEAVLKAALGNQTASSGCCPAPGDGASSAECACRAKADPGHEAVTGR